MFEQFFSKITFLSQEIRLRCLRAREESDAEDDMNTNNPAEQLQIIQNAARHKIILQVGKDEYNLIIWEKSF